MPALDARLESFHAAHTRPLGVSVDSAFAHAAWGESLGGIRFPLLSDFHPKGKVADSFGLYLADGGITDRATVLIDAGGIIRHISSVTPAGKRDMDELLKLCQDHDAGYEGAKEPVANPLGIEGKATLYVKEPCTFSRWALCARANLKLGDAVEVKNVTTDPAAREELEKLGGKNQAPALAMGDELLYESEDIIDLLAARACF